MSEQSNLPGFDAEAPRFRPDVTDAGRGKLLGYTLFFAIVPEPVDARFIARTVAGLCSLHGLSGDPVPDERLHITQHAIASYGVADAIPQAVVDGAKAAAARVACPLLPIVFDHLLSFPGSDAVVLRCDARSDAAVARLRKPLARELRRVGASTTTAALNC